MRNSSNATVIRIASGRPEHLLYFRHMLKFYVSIVFLQTFDKGQRFSAIIAKEIIVSTCDPSWTGCHSPKLFFPSLPTTFLKFIHLGLQICMTIFTHFIFLALATWFALKIFLSVYFQLSHSLIRFLYCLFFLLS